MAQSGAGHSVINTSSFVLKLGFPYSPTSCQGYGDVRHAEKHTQKISIFEQHAINVGGQ